MTSYDEAQRILAGVELELGSERVAIHSALGRVMAESVLADRDFPPTDRSAMDGFAVIAEDLVEGAAKLRVIGEVRAGQSPGKLRLARGEVARIFTGAVVPEGADAVVMVERTQKLDDRDIEVLRPVAARKKRAR